MWTKFTLNCYVCEGFDDSGWNRMNLYVTSPLNEVKNVKMNRNICGVPNHKIKGCAENLKNFLAQALIDTEVDGIVVEKMEEISPFKPHFMTLVVNLDASFSNAFMG